MDFRKKILVLLAIFCLVASASVACAAEDSGNCDYNTMDNYIGVAGSQYSDIMGGYAGSNYNNTTNMTNNTIGNNTSNQIIPPDFNHHEPAAGEPVKEVKIAKPVHSPSIEESMPAPSQQNHNTTGNASGEPAHNVTGNATHNITAKAITSQKMKPTGNPILALMAISAVLGGVAVIRRK